MKKMILTAVAALGMMTANAQQAMKTPSFWQNWSIGVDGRSEERRVGKECHSLC